MAKRSKRTRSVRPEAAAEKVPKAASNEDDLTAQIAEIDKGDDVDSDADDDTLLAEEEIEGDIVDVNAGGDKNDKDS